VRLGLNTHKARHTIEGNIVPVQAAHVYSASSVQPHAFLDDGERSASASGRYTPQKGTASWVDPRAGLESLLKTKPAFPVTSLCTLSARIH